MTLFNKNITGLYEEHIIKNILKTKEDSDVKHSKKAIALC